MSRKATPIDPEILENLGAVGCTIAEVAGFFRCSERTIYTRIKTDPWRSAWERGQGRGRATLRRMQWKAAQRGNPTMLVWLGKQMLGQTDGGGSSGADQAKASVVALMETLRGDAAADKRRAARKKAAAK